MGDTGGRQDNETVNYGELFAHDRRLQNQPLVNLLKVRAVAARMPDPEWRWLLAGINDYLRQPSCGKKSFDHFLGLSGNTGQCLAYTRIRQEIRDCHLQAAAQWLQQEHRCSSWQACGLLADAITRFRLLYKRLQNSGRAVADPLERHLFDAFQTGRVIPDSQVSLDRIVKSASTRGGYS